MWTKPPAGLCRHLPPFLFIRASTASASGGCVTACAWRASLLAGTDRTGCSVTFCTLRLYVAGTSSKDDLFLHANCARLLTLQGTSEWLMQKLWSWVRKVFGAVFSTPSRVLQWSFVCALLFFSTTVRAGEGPRLCVKCSCAKANLLLTRVFILRQSAEFANFSLSSTCTYRLMRQALTPAQLVLRTWEGHATRPRDVKIGLITV